MGRLRPGGGLRGAVRAPWRFLGYAASFKAGPAPCGKRSAGAWLRSPSPRRPRDGAAILPSPLPLLWDGGQTLLESHSSAAFGGKRPWGCENKLLAEQPLDPLHTCSRACYLKAYQSLPLVIPFKTERNGNKTVRCPLNLSGRS